MNILETDRLVLRHLASADAPFILELLNDPDWLRYIGDRGVRSVAHSPQVLIRSIGCRRFRGGRRSGR